MDGHKALIFNQKYLYLCSEHERKGIWNDMRVNFHFWMNYHFNISTNSVE